MTHRKVFFGIVALAILLSVQTGTARAESFGKAILPHYELYFRDGAIHGGQTLRTYVWLHLSNISDSTITVKVAFYDQDGQLVVGDDNNPLSGAIQLGEAQANYSEMSSTGYTVSFDLDARESENIIIYPDLYFAPSTYDAERGFAKISWSSTADIAVSPLVATYEQHKSYSYQGDLDPVTILVPINNGMPF